MWETYGVIDFHLRRKKIDTFGYFAGSELKRVLETKPSNYRFDKVLEIGSYEGIFTCYAADNLAEIVHTVDPFLQSDEGSKVLNTTEKNFFRNISFSKNLHKIHSHKCTSQSFFLTNILSFDFIYIDGSHESEIVESDLDSSLLCCANGGIIWVDDYRSSYKTLHSTIKNWLDRNINSVEVIHDGYQLGLRKK